MLKIKRIVIVYLALVLLVACSSEKERQAQFQSHQEKNKSNRKLTTKLLNITKLPNETLIKKEIIVIPTEGCLGCINALLNLVPDGINDSTMIFIIYGMRAKSVFNEKAGGESDVNNVYYGNYTELRLYPSPYVVTYVNNEPDITVLTAENIPNFIKDRI